MKKLLFILLPVLLATRAQALPGPLNAHTKLYHYIKVWGFLKYYHPRVAAGQIDADSLFRTNFPAVEQAADTAALNTVLEKMVESLGVVDLCGKCKPPDGKELFIRNLSNSWLEQPGTLNGRLQEKLRYIEQNRFQGKPHRYMFNGFEGNINEPSYPNMVFPDKAGQLMALARVWNIVNYIFPYKYMATENWDSVLQRLVPVFSEARSRTEYEKGLLHLIAATDDSHCGSFAIQNKSAVYGQYAPPFTFRLLKDTAVVTSLIDSAVCATGDIQVNDMIVQLNGRTLTEAALPFDSLMPASNAPRKRLQLSSPELGAPFRSNDSSMQLVLLRNGQRLDRRISGLRTDSVFAARVKPHQLRYGKEVHGLRSDYVFKSPQPNVGMLAALSLSMLYRKDSAKTAVDSVMQLVRQHAAGLIIDLREYCYQQVIYDKLLPALGLKRKPFADYFIPNIHYPGTLVNTYFSKQRGPNTKTGANYPGKLVVLVNENSLSQAEWVTMILQATGKVTVIGSQTAGADGDIVMFQVPGGYRGVITGRRVCYPDGTESQRQGVKIDIPVAATAAGIAAGRDEQLERALQFIENGR
ncbi:S41 family peptidase [Chitinophaga sp.]|uniref:S41 family peptidase n=1 Tax=Chitinophaga sp. TaxID=1869181 RepID=UPI0031CF73C6